MKFRRCEHHYTLQYSPKKESQPRTGLASGAWHADRHSMLDGFLNLQKKFKNIGIIFLARKASRIRVSETKFCAPKSRFSTKKRNCRRNHIPEEIASHEAPWDFVMIVEQGETIVTYPDIPKPLYYYAITASSPEELAQLSAHIESQIIVRVNES